MLGSLPRNATFADLRSRYETLLGKLRPYAQELMRGPSEMSPAERELIAAFVSGLNSCGYCYGTHANVAKDFGVSEHVLRALLEDVETAPIEPRLKHLMHYVRKLTLTPSRLSRADAEAVRDAGVGEEGLVRAVAVCAYFNQMNRLVEGTGIGGGSAQCEAGASRLLAEGYDGADSRRAGD